jgi:hypothetical protein
MTFPEIYFVFVAPVLVLVVLFALSHFTKPKRHNGPAE